MTIFIDMDDVLADTYGKHIELYNEEFKEALSPTHFESGEVWQNVPKVRQSSIHQHVHMKGFFRNLKPLKDSQIVMEALWHKYDVYIATAATQFPNSLKEKSDWLDEYFPFVTWQHRIMCGHKFILRGDLLIDDRSYNLEKFEGDTLLFTSPHNINTKGYKRVNDWLDVARALL